MVDFATSVLDTFVKIKQDMKTKVSKGELVVIDSDYTTLDLAFAATPTNGILEIRQQWNRTTSLVINKSCTIRWARGGSLTSTNATLSSLLNITASDVTLDRPVLIGTDSTTSGVNRGVLIAGTLATPVRNLKIINGSLRNFNKDAIYGSFVQDFEIRGNVISDISYAAIMFLSSSYGRIIGNKINNLTQPGTFVNSYGISVTKGYGDVATIPRSSDILISGNIIDGVPFWEAIDSHGGERLIISDNQIYNAYVGIAMVPCPSASGNADAQLAPRDIIIENNIIDSRASDGNRRSAIQLIGGFKTVITDTPHEYATGIIRGNIIRNHGSITSDLGAGMTVYATRGVSINNNLLVNSNRQGVMAYYHNIGLDISGNTFVDGWSPNLSSAPAIAVRLHQNDVTIRGNKIVRGEKVATVVNTHGVMLTAGQTGHRVIVDVDNDFSAATTPVLDPDAKVINTGGSISLPSVDFLTEYNTALGG